MITCPKCEKEMRKVHEYTENSDKMVVYYCCDCDVTISAPKRAESIIWDTKKGE